MYRCELVFGSEVHIYAVLRGAYQALLGTPLDDNEIEEVTEPRGFMIGVGQTSTYSITIGADVRISADTWWEDNIADPEEIAFGVSVRSPMALDRVANAVIAAAASHGVPLRGRR